MAQKRLEPDKFQLRSDSRGWALCVRAGTSLPLFPLWEELVNDLICRVTNELDGPHIASPFATLKGKFSLDALVEAARDRKGMKEKEFAEYLGEILYNGITHTFSGNWQLFTRFICGETRGAFTR